MRKIYSDKAIFGERILAICLTVFTQL